MPSISAGQVIDTLKTKFISVSGVYMSNAVLFRPLSTCCSRPLLSNGYGMVCNDCTEYSHVPIGEKEITLWIGLGQGPISEYYQNLNLTILESWIRPFTNPLSSILAAVELYEELLANGHKMQKLYFFEQKLFQSEVKEWQRNRLKDQSSINLAK